MDYCFAVCSAEKVGIRRSGLDLRIRECVHLEYDREHVVCIAGVAEDCALPMFIGKQFSVILEVLDFYECRVCCVVCAVSCMQCGQIFV